MFLEESKLDVLSEEGTKPRLDPIEESLFIITCSKNKC